MNPEGVAIRLCLFMVSGCILVICYVHACVVDVSLWLSDLFLACCYSNSACVVMLGLSLGIGYYAISATETSVMLGALAGFRLIDIYVHCMFQVNV